MITLVHTGMQVPDQIRLTGMRRIDVGHAFAWTALVRQGKRTLGRAANDGNGATLFEPHDQAGREAMAAFVSQCRDRDGEPLTEEFVLDTLAEEHTYARDVSFAYHRGEFLVRCWDAYDTPGLLPLHLPSTRPPDYAAGLAAARERTLPRTTVRAELWMGPQRGWVEFYPVPDRSDPV